MAAVQQSAGCGWPEQFILEDLSFVRGLAYLHAGMVRKGMATEWHSDRVLGTGQDLEHLHGIDKSIGYAKRRLKAGDKN